MMRFFRLRAVPLTTDVTITEAHLIVAREASRREAAFEDAVTLLGEDDLPTDVIVDFYLRRVDAA